MLESRSHQNTIEQEPLLFTPFQLLSTFQRILVAEEVHLNLDYHTLTADCLQLFRSMHEVFPPVREFKYATLMTAIQLAGDLADYCKIKGFTKEIKIELPPDSPSGIAARLMN